MLNIRKELMGWVVRLARDGKEYSKYFRFSDGGIRKSLEQAKRLPIERQCSQNWRIANSCISFKLREAGRRHIAK
jgi:hypothetical protein